MIEMNIRVALTNMNMIQAAVKNRIVSVYSELYQGQTHGYKVARIYYAVNIFFFTILSLFAK